MASQLDAIGATDHTDAPTLAVFWWGQVAMVLANVARLPTFSTGDREAPLGVTEMLVGLVIVVGLTAAIRVRSLPVDSVTIAAALFVLVGGSSAIWTAVQYEFTPAETLISLAYLARWVFYLLLYVALRASIGRSRVGVLWRAVETMLLIFAIFGIFQAAFLPGFAQMVYPDSRAVVDWDLQGHRLVSTVLDPNIAGAMLMIAVLIHFSLISTGAEAGGWRLLVFLTAITLTVSRSAAVGLVAGIAVIFAARGLSRRLIRIMVVLGCLVLVMSPKLIQLALAYSRFDVGEGSSAGARVLAWLRAIQVFLDHPVLGVGFNTYGFMGERYGWTRLGAASYGSDGGLLFIAAMTGLVGLAVYCGMLGLVISKCRRIWRNTAAPSDHRGLAIGTAASTVAIVVNSLFVNSLLTTNVMELLWVLWAAVSIMASPDVYRRARDGAEPRLVPLRV